MNFKKNASSNISMKARRVYIEYFTI